MLNEFINKLFGALLAGAVINIGFALFCYDECLREVNAIKAAHWIYKAYPYLINV